MPGKKIYYGTGAADALFPCYNIYILSKLLLRAHVALIKPSRAKKYGGITRDPSFIYLRESERREKGLKRLTSRITYLVLVHLND
jgi:hypothetical protein